MAGQGRDRRQNLFHVHQGQIRLGDEEARESEVISALRSGNDMTVHAHSLRGTATTYTYSLNGVTAALRRMSTCN
jgi:hypothetical protein